MSMSIIILVNVLYFLLQIWRPAAYSDMVQPPPSSNTAPDIDWSSPEFRYRLVGQTYVRPADLRRHEVRLPSGHGIAVERGDLVGIYFPVQNPIGWSGVPCPPSDRIDRRHRQRVATGPDPVSGRALLAGDTVSFRAVSVDSPSPCRQYSIAALFGNCQNNFMYMYHASVAIMMK